MGYIKHRNHTKPSIPMLRACVEYDPATGTFTWMCRPVEHFTDERAAASWNTRFAGRPVTKTQRGYLVVTITIEQRETYSMAHRVAWALMTGEWPEQEVDHIDRDRGNNRWANLRQATHQENQWNKAAGVRNRSGVVGVHQHTANGTWIAQCRVDGKTRHLGSFKSMDEAVAARAAATAINHGQFAQAQ